MADNVLAKLEELLAQGAQLVPVGGFEFSGYNARLQNKYLEWRKGCLETLEAVGPIGFPLKNKVLGDQNGGYFFQSSAQLIQNCMKELSDKLKASPELASQAAAQASSPAATVTSETQSGGRVLKPPPKPAGAAPAAAPAPTAAQGVGNKVYVIGEDNDPLRMDLGDFLKEVGLEEISIKREKGTMLMLEKLQDQKDAKYAFFVFNSEDVGYAMFELGHFVGKLGQGRVCVLHMSDVNVPKNIPGVTVRPIVVKLEEASLSILKELKGLGYKFNL
ncbi:MAG: nucleotide-binding protein [Ignavibacteriales bacterium]|nr:nucleotide-binding protein [Ignavibacteriales bacterium]